VCLYLSFIIFLYFLQTSTEHYYFWMNALKDCCAGESCLQQVLLSQDSREEVTQSTRSDFIDKMAAAEANYHTGIVALKVSKLSWSS